MTYISLPSTDALSSESVGSEVASSGLPAEIRRAPRRPRRRRRTSSRASEQNQAAASGPAETDRAASAELVDGMLSLFKLLSDEMRLRILLALQGRRELHVGALCAQLGEAQSSVSHHLALLLVAGLIRRRRAGKHNYYSFATSPIAALLEQAFGRHPPGDLLAVNDFVLTRRQA